ncbi:MAG TPA: patatin-like phospholipase family protein [Pyrinomonadaceae bacterium]|jgi:predicted acylesterase/phospholipase RssA|nr:patatin-like phospholipase family protein [Pyrinomonadaceae bacterium]
MSEGGGGRHKQAMVLSGGGANGAYEVGVMRALFNGLCPTTCDAPLDPDIFSGTSIGSFNASFLVSRWEAGGPAAVAELERLWLERLSRDGAAGENNGYRFLANPFELFDPRRFAADPLGAFGQFAQDGLRLAWDFFDRLMYVVNPDEDSPMTTRLLHTIAVDNFISREPFRRLVKDVIDFGAIRASPKELKIATTNWETGQVREFGNYDFTDGLGPRIIMASSAIPGFFTPEEVGSQPYVDGSVLMNTPLKPVIVSGARVMHIIYLDPDVDSIPIHYLSNVLSTLYRTQVINWASVLNDDISDAENINEALIALGLAGRDEGGDGDEGGGGGVEEKRVMKALAKFGRHLEKAARYKMLTIHRYHPRDELGGALSLLDLRRERIEYLVERGFRDAAGHDCNVSRCVIPAEPNAGPRASADPYRARPE